MRITWTPWRQGDLGSESTSPRLSGYLIWLLGTVGYEGSRRTEVTCHYLCHGPVEQDEPGACCSVQICSGELEKGRVGTQLSGDQEAAPYPNLEAAKEKGNSGGRSTESEVLLTQGFPCGDCPTPS